MRRVVKLFDTIGPRFGDRNGGYTAHRPHRLE
jgi:ribosomal protein L17